MPTELKILLETLSFKNLGFNILDWIIIAVFVFYIIEGFEVGFLNSFFDLLNFVLSFIFALKFYSLFGKFLVDNFSIPLGFSNVIGFFVVAFLSGIIFGVFLRKLLHLFRNFFGRRKDNKEEGSVSLAWLKFFNRFLGIFPGIISAFILVSFILTVVVSLPFSPFLKKTISSSRMGNLFVSNTQGFEKTINNIFGGALNETISFLTVEPEEEKIVSLRFKTTSVNIDEEAEQQMFLMLNKERESRGLNSLVFDKNIAKVAREHSKDMLSRGYFSHYTPEGISPFDRLSKAKISYLYAGENLALAPNVSLAMQGLMNSPGHKANILSPNFKKVGVGVIDAGIYGEMFTQNFTD